MFRSLRLGTAFGIGIFVHWTFVLLLLFVVYMARPGGTEAALYGVVMVLAVFACVVMHELGHALMARRFGIGTRDITLLPIGGVARLEKAIEEPWAEFWIAIAGPAVNVAIALVLFAVLELGGVELSLRSVFAALSIDPNNDLADLRGTSFGVRLLMGLLAANGVLMLFNLIPAFPMDGGRVLRALLSLGIGALAATEFAALLGAIFALLLAAWGVVGLLYAGNPLMILVGMFVFLAGQQELAAVRRRVAEQQPDPAPTEELPPMVLHLDTSAIPPDPDFSGFTWDRRARVWVQWRNGRPIHVCHGNHE